MKDSYAIKRLLLSFTSLIRSHCIMYTMKTNAFLIRNYSVNIIINNKIWFSVFWSYFSRTNVNTLSDEEIIILISIAKHKRYLKWNNISPCSGLELCYIPASWGQSQEIKKTNKWMELVPGSWQISFENFKYYSWFYKSKDNSFNCN